MEGRAPIPAVRRGLATAYALRDFALERLAGPLSPAMRRLERDHLASLEQTILDTEARLARFESQLPR